MWFENHRDEIDYKEEDSFCNVKKISSVKCPVMILHGKADKTIPVRHSRLLKQRNENVRLWEVNDMEHNNIHDCLIRDDMEYSQEFYYFLQEIYCKSQNIYEKDHVEKEQHRRNEKLLELIYEDLDI